MADPTVSLSWPVDGPLGLDWQRTLAQPLDLQWLAEIDSTNAELLRRGQAGRLGPALLVADAQTAGRGRQGRPWQARAGDALLGSLGCVLAPLEWSGLSLVVGLSLVESLHPALRIKWPNDVWLDGRKLAGILIETTNPPEGLPPGARWVVIGFGINLRLPPWPTGPASAGVPAQFPAALEAVWPKVGADAVLARVLPALLRDVACFAERGFAPFQARYQARDALWQQPVQLWSAQEGQPPREGLAGGVDTQGRLLFRSAQGTEALSGG